MRRGDENGGEKRSGTRSVERSFQRGVAGAGGTRRGRAESDTKRDFSGKEAAARGEGKKGREERKGCKVKKQDDKKNRKNKNGKREEENMNKRKSRGD